MLGNVNPLAPITVGAGFIITVNPGIVLINGTPTTVISTVISLTPSATNYIYVNSSGVVVSNTSGFPANVLPISTVITSSTSVTSVVDSRSDFTLPSTVSNTSNSIFLPYGGAFNAGGTAGLFTQNSVFLQGVLIDNNITVNNIIVNAATPDAGANYDWGIYDSNGSLKCHVGSHVASAGLIVDLPVIGGPISISAGKYYFAITTNGAAPALVLSNISNRQINFLVAGTSVTASSGGTLPSTISIPSDTWSTSAANWPAFATH